MTQSTARELSNKELEALVDGKQEVENTVEQVWGEGTTKYVLDIDTVEKPDWIVEGLVVRQGLTLVYGESQVGKTTFCLYLIDALQTGKSFFNRKCKQAKVLIGEQDQSPPLLRAQKDKLGIPKKLWLVKVPLRWNNKKDEFNDDLKNLLHLCRPDVLIIDAYTSLGIEDINHPSVSLTFDWLRLYSQKYNCAFVLTHHTGLSGRQMGSNLNIAKMDSVIALRKSGKKDKSKSKVFKITASQEKLKADSCEDIELTFDTNNLRMTAEETIKDMVFRLKSEGKTDEDVKSEVTEGKPDSVGRYLREWAKEHKGEADFSAPL